MDILRKVGSYARDSEGLEEFRQVHHGWSTILPSEPEVNQTLEISAVTFWSPASKDWNAETTLDMATTGIHGGIEKQISGLRWGRYLSLQSIRSDN
jgi:hypothetical protein